MAIIQYFAYGSNMLTKRLQARCPTASARYAAYAEGWQLSFYKKGRDGSGKAMISKTLDAGIYGVVFNIEEDELAELDRIEGVGSGYERIDNFPVQARHTNRNESVVTYVASSDHTNSTLRPFDWYLNLVVAGAREHGLPAGYCLALQAMPSAIDPKADRQSRLDALELLRNIRL